MKTSFATRALGAALLLSLGVAANAATFSAVFPSDNSTVVGSVGAINANEIGFFWSAFNGDMVSESWTTGLATADALDLNLNITQNWLDVNYNPQIDWDVRVNGTSVGTWSWTAADGTGPLALSYNFAPIAATGTDTFEVGMYVTNVVPGGLGSIALGKNDTKMTLTGEPVPEPASIAALGLGALAFIRRRRSK
jgi:hypothetical protein